MSAFSAHASFSLDRLTHRIVRISGAAAITAALAIGCSSGTANGSGDGGTGTSLDGDGSNGVPTTDGGPGPDGSVDDIPTTCVLQKESLSVTYCERVDHERLFVCPDDKPSSCKAAAVANGVCCPAKSVATTTRHFGCGRTDESAYAHSLFVELQTFEGYDGVQTVRVGELIKGARAFARTSVRGSLFESSSMVSVGDTGQWEWWANFAGPVELAGVDVGAVDELPLRKMRGNHCGEVGSDGCVVTDVAEGEAVPTLETSSANACNLSYEPF